MSPARGEREPVEPEPEGAASPNLDAEVRQLLERLGELLADPRAPSSITDPKRIAEVHIADSLSGLELAPLATARRIADIGSGAGLPGLVLAIALPEARVDLVESISRKAGFIDQAIAELGLRNARALDLRAEELAAGQDREAYDVVTARAVGRLATLCELASPLLADGGALLAWKGRRDPEEEAEADHAAAALAMAPVEVRWVGPYAGSENRHLHLYRKAGPTPTGLPRRPGMAKKRPLGTD